MLGPDLEQSLVSLHFLLFICRSSSLTVKFKFSSTSTHFNRVELTIIKNKN